jgi:hypothetical protein
MTDTFMRRGNLGRDICVAEKCHMNMKTVIYKPKREA